MIGIWPLIMGVTMWVQMKLNPAPPDPMQQKIFAWMPVFFTFLLASFPAGLVIYWAWNNSLSVIQQSVIMARQGVEIPLLENLGIKKIAKPDEEKTRQRRGGHRRGPTEEVEAASQDRRGRSAKGQRRGRERRDRTEELAFRRSSACHCPRRQASSNHRLRGQSSRWLLDRRVKPGDDHG